MDHLTANGTVRIQRRVYWVRGQGTLAPADRYLGIAGASLSVGARELCCRASRAVSFVKAVQDLQRQAQLTISPERLRQVVEHEGRRLQQDQREGLLEPGWQAEDCAVAPAGPTRLYSGADGVMVPLVTMQEKARRRKGRRRGGKPRPATVWRAHRVRRRVRGADQPYKEFKIACFYDQDRRHQHAVGTAGDHEALGRLWRREAGKLGLGRAQQKICVSDGAEWISRQARMRLPMLDVRILDYYHLRQQVGTAQRVCFGEGSDVGDRWSGLLMGLVLEQGPGALLVGIEQTRRRMRSGGKRKALEQLGGYVGKRAEMLDYPGYRAAGWDIGSGPTASFCGTLTARLKGNGMRWDSPNAEAMMALAALEHSHQWQRHWTRQRQASP